MVLHPRTAAKEMNGASPEFGLEDKLESAGMPMVRAAHQGNRGF